MTTGARRVSPPLGFQSPLGILCGEIKRVHQSAEDLPRLLRLPHLGNTLFLTWGPSSQDQWAHQRVRENKRNKKGPKYSERFSDGPAILEEKAKPKIPLSLGVKAKTAPGSTRKCESLSKRLLFPKRTLCERPHRKAQTPLVLAPKMGQIKNTEGGNSPQRVSLGLPLLARFLTQDSELLMLRPR